MSEEKPQSWLTEYLPPGSLTNFSSSSFKKPAQEDNAMNKSVTNLWNLHKSPSVSGAASPAVSGAATPVDVATPVNEDLPATPSAQVTSVAQGDADTTTTTAAAAAATTTTTDAAADSTKSKKRTKAQKDAGSSSKRSKSNTYNK